MKHNYLNKSFQQPNRFGLKDKEEDIVDMLRMHLWISVRRNSRAWPIVLRRPLSLKLSKS